MQTTEVKPKDYYFTFGQSHISNSGVHMCYYWVRVRAVSYEKARHYFIQHFTFFNMPAIDKFAFQYTQEDFKPMYFTGGEYYFIDAQKIEVEEIAFEKMCNDINSGKTTDFNKYSRWKLEAALKSGKIDKAIQDKHSYAFQMIRDSCRESL